MSIELDNVASGYSTGIINNNFQRLEEYVNNNLLNRDGVGAGEANQMELPLDMNSNPVLNASVDPDDPGSLLTREFADSLYVKLLGDTMQGSLNMAAYPVFVRVATHGNEPARKDELDQERSHRQAGDANLQRQISETQPLESSAFSPISWHKQIVENSVDIPDDVNAWSFGPTMTITQGQAVTIGNNSFWTIANGEQQ